MVKKVDRDVGKKIKRVPTVSFVIYNNTQIKKKFGGKALTFIKKNKLHVGKMPPFLKKKGYTGYRQTGTTIGKKKGTTIFIDSSLKKKEIKRTFWHEAGHHKAKKILKTSIRKKLHKEIKGLPIYKSLKKEGYTSKQIPEEILVELFAKSKSQGKVTVSKKLPTLKKQFNKLIKKA